VSTEREPRFCPFCGKPALYLDVAPLGWPTYSAEDPDNKALLQENQCANEGANEGECHGRSFWT
jgi:hypothetical protein